MSDETEQSDQTDALQSALAAEHAAVYAYGVVGGVLGATSAPANAAYAAHRGRRDQLMAMIGGEAVAAEPAYELPFAVPGPGRAQQLGVRVEQRCAEVYADVVSRTSGPPRVFAARALADCAVRGLDWGGDFEAFPGLRGR
ncbi:MAG TPA: ferritin-like domain-containing protein [Nocardioidaceae bacterium]|nr:ferritin-like domain-containing protein [Nocardioidaceae bacterium]